MRSTASSRIPCDGSSASVRLAALSPPWNAPRVTPAANAVSTAAVTAAARRTRRASGICRAYGPSPGESGRRPLPPGESLCRPLRTGLVGGSGAPGHAPALWGRLVATRVEEVDGMCCEDLVCARCGGYVVE